jgi:hypothetical protein
MESKTSGKKQPELTNEQKKILKGCGISCLVVILPIAGLFAYFYYSTNEPNKEVNKTKEVVIKPEKKFPEVEAIIPRLEQIKSKYIIINEKKDLILRKSNLNIRLHNKVDKNTLKDIALSLRCFRRGYDRLWIFYYLPNQPLESACWATSHFTPDLEIEIMGATNDDIQRLKIVQVKYKVIGKWLNTSTYTGCSIIVYEKGNKNFMKITYKDGSSLNQEIMIKQENGKTRYDMIGNKHGEYYIIENDKTLGMYGKNGKFDEANRF